MKFNKLNVVIITCWILLVIALVLKLFGLNWFEPATDNQTFISICNYIESNLWLKLLTTCMICILLESLTILAMIKQKFYTSKTALIFIPLIIASSIISWYNQYIKFAVDILILIVVPLLLKVNWKRVVIGVILIFLFQAISMVAKNLGSWSLNNETIVYTFIFEIDTLIMNLLYYLYSNYKLVKKKGDVK